MVIEVIDEAGNEQKNYYMMPKRIALILKSTWGTSIHDPYHKMGEILYKSFMTFCKPLGDSIICSPDITVHLS